MGGGHFSWWGGLPRGLMNLPGFATGAPKGTKPEEIPRGGLKRNLQNFVNPAV
jgi:hypothetical protein